MKELNQFIISITIVLLVSSCASFLAYGSCKQFSDVDGYAQCISARGGNKESQYQMGLNAFKKDDMKMAVVYLQDAATRVYETVSIYNAVSFDQPEFIPVKTGKFDPGHYEAQLLLVKIYEEGIGVKVNKRRAKVYRKLAGIEQ